MVVEIVEQGNRGIQCLYWKLGNLRCSYDQPQIHLVLSKWGAKSWIDIVICTKGWLDVWQGLIQEVLNRDVSDHCPILVKNNNYDWGPEPFRMLTCWFSKAIELKKN